MSEPVDLMQAAQAAVFGALKAGVDPSLSPVFQHVPENTQPPMIIVGAIDSENDGSKGEQVERMTIEVQAIFRGAKRSQLLAMLHAVRRALALNPLAADGVEFSEPHWLGASASEAASDGVTYAGIAHFEVFAEPA